jgi:hypothetical protein
MLASASDHHALAHAARELVRVSRMRERAREFDQLGARARALAPRGSSVDANRPSI